MHPEQHYIQDHFDLYQNIDDPAYLEKEETFESWYENPIDLPGRWYLQVMRELFKETRLAKGTFIGLGRQLNLKNITCPVYLLADESTTSPPRNRFLTLRNILARQRTRSRRSSLPAATSASSWARAR
jgi:poly(3-hydroxyalkanoate) synthetase